MSEPDEVQRLASEFLSTVRNISMTQSGEIVTLHQVAEYLGPQVLGATGSDYVSKLSKAGQYLVQRRLLEGVDGSKTQGPSMFRITREGIDEVEGRNQPPEPSVSNMFNISGGNFYQSAVGTHNTNTFTGDFDFSTVERRIEEEAREADKEDLRQLVAEVKELLERGETINKGFLARWNDRLKEYGWLSSAVAGWLLNFATQG